MSDVVYNLCFFGCRMRTIRVSKSRQLFGESSRILLLVSIASCLLGDDVLHAK